MRGVAAILLVLIVGANAGDAGAAEVSWPQPLLPADAELESPGESIAVNGMPLRIYRFTTALSQAELARDFERNIDGNFVRKAPTARDARATVAGRVGGFWITLQMADSAQKRTIATWSAAPRFIAGAQRRAVPPPGFPADAKLLQQVDSYDTGKTSQIAIGTAPHAVDAVVQQLQQRMRELGFAKQSFPARNWNGPDEFAAVYTNGRAELVVSLRQEREGTAVVINHVASLERLQ